MKEIIRKFTMGHPKQVIEPAIWYFVEGMAISMPAVAMYFAINIILEYFKSGGTLNTQGLWNLCLVMVVLFFFQFVASSFTFLRTFLPGCKNSAQNKIDFIHKLRTLPLGYFSKKESGELINTFTGDFLALEQSMVGIFVSIFGVSFSCLLTSVFIFFFNPKMALAFYLTVPVSGLIIFFSMKILGKLSRHNRKAKDKTTDLLGEYLLGMKTLKSYNQTGKGFHKLKDAYMHLMKVNIKGETIGGALLSLALTFVRLGLPLMCFIGAYLILGGSLDLVSYLSLVIIATKIISPLLLWVSNTAVLRGHYVSATRIDTIMQETPLLGTESLNTTGDIVFDKVCFCYNSQAPKKDFVLNQLSFKIPKGKLTAIVGPSGGGKSTILRLIARFWDVTSGKISCEGKNLKNLNPDLWLRNISMVLQDVYLFNISIRENIHFGRKDATDEEVIDAAKRAGCHEFITALPNGYDTIVAEGGSTLSGGEKQRISIARAILKDAPILLLDEPTSSLDARNEVLVQRAIADLVKGKTVIMIAHRLKTVEEADQIVTLDKGKIVESGTHSELLENKGLYSKLFALQNDSQNWTLG